MNLADFQAANAPQVDNPLYRFAQMPARISFPQGGSTLGIASPRQQAEAQRIRQTVQDNVITPAVNAVTDPFYAATPGMDQRRQDARRRILEKVAAVTTDPMAATFAGVGAKMADKAALAKSLEMKAAGIPDREIWKETGWTHAFPDGKPRFEIPDNTAKFTTAVPDVLPQNSTLALPGVYQHQELYSNYPSLKKTKVSRGMGEYDSEISRVNIPDTSDYGRQTMGHELQHAVQDQEGFAQGGSPSYAFFESAMPEEYAKMSKELATQRQELLGGNRFKKDGSLTAKEQGQIDDILPPQLYQKLAGEVESRLTQRRMDLDAAQRRERYPIDEMDVKPEDQIVRFK